ncbi:MAG: response regulator [Candidatus Methanoperedens sp.]|nr:response regulator [Candidatus Methanoperedens sp.]
MTANNQILVVEDEIIVADYIRKSLQNMGYSVPSIVSSGENAIKEIEKNNPDLVLMDIVLEGKMDGIEAAEIIRSRFNIPVVYLTANSEENILERAKITEPFGYIIKPFNERDLRTNIEIALYKHKMERELKDRELRLYEAEKLLLKRQRDESEENYRELFENANDGIYVHDTDGFFLTVNNALCKIFECATKDELIGTNISCWLTPESLGIAKDIINKYISGEPVKQPAVLELITKNKKHIFIEFRNRVIKDNDRISAIHGVARDITENRLLKQELKKSNKQQKLLCHLIQGTRGGKTRALILKHLSDKSYNAHQLATLLKMDYKTIRHHIKILIKNGIIGKVNERSSDSYFISNNIDFEF